MFCTSTSLDVVVYVHIDNLNSSERPILAILSLMSSLYDFSSFLGPIFLKTHDAELDPLMSNMRFRLTYIIKINITHFSEKIISKLETFFKTSMRETK